MGENADPVDVNPTPFAPVPLTPASLLRRARDAYGNEPAVVGPNRRMTYDELARRCEQVAGALAALGIEPGDRVSILAPNTHVALEAHFAVSWAGGVLNMLNTRLSASELRAIVAHAGSKVLIADSELAPLAREVAAALPSLRIVVAGGDDDEYERLLEAAMPVHRPTRDENDLLALNYTSGTTGRPKGVMYSHRGAYLQALAMTAQARLVPGAVFLWTLPMFHCNGWCFPWAVTAVGGVHLELRQVNGPAIWQAVRDHGVTHFNAAPTVLADVARSAEPGERTDPIHVATGGAPPSPTLLDRLEQLGIVVTHLYGLTETYGPAVVCEERPWWRSQDRAARATQIARQGLANVVTEGVRVVDGLGTPVPRDGTTQGEVQLRGNNVMLGYYRDPDATRSASTDDGWFRTGDIGVVHDDGYLELRDRAKDVIISGGENISSIEVEQVLLRHPGVEECAVVAAPDEQWGEVPVAFVSPADGTHPEEAELIQHVKDSIARYKAPRRVIFGPLPKTATGKIQKFALRERLGSERDADPQRAGPASSQPNTTSSPSSQRK